MTKRSVKTVWLALLVGAACACQIVTVAGQSQPPPAKQLSPAALRVVVNARKQTTQTRFYDPAYVSLPYPNGDVPIDRGVCTDVVFRAVRAGGVDLQKQVHEDMSAYFAAYPKKWGARRTDKSIDHRRVPNLQTYFRRHGKSLPVTHPPANYRPGDIVSWKLSNGLDHIGVVSDAKVAGREQHAVIHNIGQGARQDDVLFAWKITGHYRFFP